MAKKKYLPDFYVPTAEEVKKFIVRPYSDNPLVGNKKDDALFKLFRDLIPENKNIQDIIIKCSTLNALASTNVIEIQYIAEHILMLNIDERLKRGDLSLVDDIGKKINVGNSKQRSHYSFASKYCCFHQPQLYSIYDHYVALVLMELQERDKFGDFKHGGLKKYECYMKALEDFRKHYGLPENEFSKKDLDKYLWLFGKECVSEYNIRINK
ncbi:MAG: hypothetical protein J5814_02790 [Bacteroidaceae bacterium]|nr:hypothetical protein [Bacteroidaceae bacterium]